MIRVHQTADGWTVEVTGHEGGVGFQTGSGLGRFSLHLGQHEVAVVGREPEQDIVAESRAALADASAGDAFAKEREWWIRRAEREAAAAERALAEAVEREKNIWIDQVDAAELEERARCLAWVERYTGGPIHWFNWTDVRDAVRDGSPLPERSLPTRSDPPDGKAR